MFGCDGDSATRGKMSSTTSESGAGKDQKGLEGGDSGGGSLKKGPWTSAEDAILVEYVKKHGEGNWNAVQKHSGLFRCGKSCRLRWANHLRPNLKKGAFTADEEQIIIELHAKLGNKWARMAAQLPGRTDNEIKNYWNTRIKRRQRQGLPLYPPDLHLQQQSNENQQNQQSVNGGDLSHRHHHHHHEFLSSSSKLDIPNVTFDSLKPGQHSLAYSSFPSLTEASMSSILNQAMGSSQSYSLMNPIQRAKRLREAENLMSFGSAIGGGGSGMFSFAQLDDSTKSIVEPCFKATGRPYGQLGRLDGFVAHNFSFDPDPNNKNPSHSPLPFGGLMTGSHTLLNDNFSASTSLPGVKLELPSSQFAESVSITGSSNPVSNMSNSFALYPMASHLPKPTDWLLLAKNSGLFEDQLHDIQMRGGIKHPSSFRSSSSSSELPLISSGSNSCLVDSIYPGQMKPKMGDISDPTSPFDGGTSSVFSENTLPWSASPWDESSSAQSTIGKTIKSEEPNEEYISSGSFVDEDISTFFAGSDVLPVTTDWCNQYSEVGKEQSAVTDTLISVLSDALGVGFQQFVSTNFTRNGVSEHHGSCP